MVNPMKYVSLMVAVCAMLMWSCSPKVATPPPPPPGPIAHYSLDGNADDISGNGSNGTIYGATPTTDRFGNANAALKFDGKDDFIEISPANGKFSSIQNYTLSVWVNFEDFIKGKVKNRKTFDRQYIFCGHTYSKIVKSDFNKDGFSIFYDWRTNNAEEFRFGQVKSKSKWAEFATKIPSKSEWHHLVVITSGADARQFIDGVLVNQSTRRIENLNMMHDLYIGTFSGNNPNYVGGKYNYSFNGSIDDLRIYNRVISDKKLAILFSEK